MIVDTEHPEAVQRIAELLQQSAPEGWVQLTGTCATTSSVATHATRALLPGGEPTHYDDDTSFDLADAFDDLRRAMHQPETGAWYTATVTVTRSAPGAEAAVRLDVDADHPPEDLDVGPLGYVDDLERFPRAEASWPPWLHEQVALGRARLAREAAAAAAAAAPGGHPLDALVVDDGEPGFRRQLDITRGGRRFVRRSPRTVERWLVWRRWRRGGRDPLRPAASPLTRGWADQVQQQLFARGVAAVVGTDSSTNDFGDHFHYPEVRIQDPRWSCTASFWHALVFVSVEAWTDDGITPSEALATTRTLVDAIESVTGWRTVG